MMKDLAPLIIRHTRPSRRHLTPELVLRLITPACPLWTSRGEDVPFPDPYWAFYWPGGQAMARYILDNRKMVKNRRVVDIGCGCGAAAVAAAKMDAKHVLANDIDPYAVTAAAINAEQNEVSIETITENLIGTKLEQFDTVLVGDMFYDEEFSKLLFQWLRGLAAEGKTVLVGDPGRHGLTGRRSEGAAPLAKLAHYRLPEGALLENNGFTHTTLWQLNK